MVADTLADVLMTCELLEDGFALSESAPAATDEITELVIFTLSPTI